MKRMISRWAWIALCLCLSTTSVAWAKTKSKKSKLRSFAILDFEENGKVSPGIGRTLATILYSSMDTRRYVLLAPRLARDIVRKSGWKNGKSLTPKVLKALAKRGVRFVMTGSVSQHYRTFNASYRIISVGGRVLYSEVLPPVQSWVGLVSNLRYSIKMVLRRPSGRSNVKRAAQLKRRLAMLRRKKSKKKSPLKTFKNFSNGAKVSKGLFTLYVKKDKRGRRKIYMEIKPKQLGKVFLFSPTLESGTGEYPLLPFAMMSEFPFYFKRQNNTLMMMVKNTNFTVDPKRAISRVFSRSFTDALKLSTKVLSQPHPKRKSFLVDFNSLFKRDLVKISYVLSYGRRRFRRYFGFDRRHSRFSQIKTFPKNVEMTLDAYFRAGYMRSTVTPSGQSIRLILRYSLSHMPDGGYRPRYADDRVGHFLTVKKDMSKSRVHSRYVRYITRWHLEKKFPKRKLSVPKKPITFWLENAIPKPYRAATRKGILIWNDAFRRIGFSNAVVAKQQPAKAKWDPADVRYSSIRWFLSNGAGFAQGPSRINPITGQIYDADIRVSADMVSFLHQQFDLMRNPLQSKMWQHTGLENILLPGTSQRSLMELKKTLEMIDRRHGRDKLHRHLHAKLRRREHCVYANGAMKQAMLGWHLANMRGMISSGSKEEKKFIDQFLVSVIAHEVGHTLGLRHNFKASTLHTMKNLQNAKTTKKVGLTNSMMEYTPVNLAAPGQKQGEYWQTTLGPYDLWAIEYAYKPLPVKTPEAEIPYLKKIASRVSQPQLAYGTDEDAFGSVDPYSVDPHSTRWDLGKEPLNYYKLRLTLARELWQRIETKLETKKSSYPLMRRAFGMATGTYLRAGVMATKYVGGLYHVRDHIGDPGKRAPFTPVPAAKQRAALRFLTKNYFGLKSINWKPSLLNKLAPERLRGFSWMSIWMQRLDYPIHRIALFVQAMPMARLLHPAVLERVQDTKMRLPAGSQHLSIAEIFQSVTNAVFAEVMPKKQKRRPLLLPTSRPVKAKKKVATKKSAGKASKAGDKATGKGTKKAPAKKAPVKTVPPTKKVPAKKAVTKKAKPAAPAGLVISSVRRDLQQYYLSWLSAYCLANMMRASNASLAARMELRRVRNKLKAGMGKAKDPMTRAHIRASLDKIDLVLRRSVLVRFR